MVEIIIVNDGSKDDTPCIAEEYASKYPDIVKAEVEMMKTSGDAYIYMNNINAELFVWFSSNQIAFDNGTARTSSNSKNPVITKENGEWIDVLK